MRSTMSGRMPKSSVEELRGQVAAGQYAVDPRVLADDIVSKLALIRRVRRVLLGEDEQGRASQAPTGFWASRRRGSVPQRRSGQPRGERRS